MRNRIALSLLACVVLLAGVAGAVVAQYTGPNVNIEAKDVPLSQVIDSLFKDTGLSYTLDPGITHLRVTAVLKNVPFEVALKQVVQAAGAVYRVEGGTYTISPKSPMGGYPHSSPDMPADAVTEKIPLNFVEPGDVIPAVAQGYNSLPGHPDSLLRVAATGPGFIVLKGTPEAIEQAKKVIRLLDTPDAFPRAVRVSVTAKVTVTRDGKSQTYSATTESAGIEGAPVPLNIDAGRQPATRPPGSKAEISSGRPGAMPANALRLNLTLVPTIAPVPMDARYGNLPQLGIGLSGAGAVEGEVPFHFMKAFEVAASVASGAETTIASGSVDLGEGKVQFSVVATATAEEVRVKRPQGPPPGQGGYGGGGYGPPGAGGFGGGYGAPGPGQGAVGGFGGAPPAGVQPGAGRPGAAPGNRPAAGRQGAPQNPPPGAPQGPPPADPQPQPAPRQ